MVTIVSDLNRQKICEYIWTFYVDGQKAPFQIDETDALHFFERYYAKHPINEDDECFYYGILLYEQAFTDPPNRARYLVKAQEVFTRYREVSGETEWDVVEDRLADVTDIIESESLLEKVKTAGDMAPAIPGMVLVPSGPFPFGLDRKEMVLEPFYIDVYPVTNAQYREFVVATKYRSPRIWDVSPELSADDLPVTGVSWMDALQYCKWAQKSLPTEEQWEKAARGPKGLTYPWGEEPPTPETSNFRHDSFIEPVLVPVTNYADVPSPYGVRGMVGSVWEWTNTPYPDEDGTQILKGGSYVDPSSVAWVSAVAVLWASKKEKTDVIGFRCTKALD
jgi:formylglycine-generating enzyme required for sulfatase activity